MKSYKVRVMVEIEVPVHFNQDPRFEGPYDATRMALAQIETKIDGAEGGPRLTTAKQFRESAGREILGRRLADIARMTRAWRRQNLANVKRIIAEAEELKRTIVEDGEGVEP
jgi:hypothetical protein